MKFIKTCLPVIRLQKKLTQAFANAWELEPEKGETIHLMEYAIPPLSDEEASVMSINEQYLHQYKRDQSMFYKRVENYVSPTAYVHPKHWYGIQEGRPRITMSGQIEEVGCGFGYATAIDEYWKRIRTRRIKKIKKRVPIVAGGMVLVAGIATIGIVFWKSKNAIERKA